MHLLEREFTVYTPGPGRSEEDAVYDQGVPE
jgi:hypothetical protein